MKKALKITGITLGVLIILLIAAPVLFKDQIKARVEKAINDNLNATFSFEDVNLSLLRSFPRANVKITQLSIINKAPFAGDTLVHFDSLELKLSLGELFHGESEPMNIQSIESENGLVNIIFNKEGVGNFDIALKKEAEQPSEASKPLALKIQSYAIRNYAIRYTDQKSGMACQIDSLFHEGTGDFEQQRVDLKTKTAAKLSMSMKGANYLKKTPISLDATMDLDMGKQKYTFKENEFKINDLPLQFNGFIQLLDAGQQYDLTFKTPTASFKNFLALIPKAYAASIEGVETKGNFSVNGKVKGTYSKVEVPKMNIELISKEASFHFPNLPKSIDHININTRIVNETGKPEDTFVDLAQLAFQIDRDLFSASAKISQLSTDAHVSAELKGILNLANFAKAYPIKLAQPLSGMLKADVKTQFTMMAVEKKDYAAINNSGMIDLSGFNYASADGKKMRIERALVHFNTSRIQLNTLVATTGKSDLNASGTLDNLYGFLFRNQELQGNFALNAKQLIVSDFMTESKTNTAKTTSEPTALKIPAFLNCTITANAQKVLYDDLWLQNVKGVLEIKNQTASFKNGSTQVFDGLIKFDGLVSTQKATPDFDMNLGMQGVDIPKTFSTLKMLKKIAPIADAITGRLNATIALAGPLNVKTMAPNTDLLTGDLSGQLIGASVTSDKSAMLQSLTNKIPFLKGKSLSLNDVKAALHFDKGRVTVKPINIKYQDVKAQVSGTHGFDQTMSYTVAMDVPAKYLGNELGALASKLSANDLAKAGTLPVNATITGTFKNPKVSTDLKEAATLLATQLAQQQKDKLLDKGASLLEGILNKNKKEGDTTKTNTDNLKNKASNLLNGLFKK